MREGARIFCPRSTRWRVPHTQRTGAVQGSSLVKRSATRPWHPGSGVRGRIGRFAQLRWACSVPARAMAVPARAASPAPPVATHQNGYRPCIYIVRILRLNLDRLGSLQQVSRFVGRRRTGGPPAGCMGYERGRAPSRKGRASGSTRRRSTTGGRTCSCTHGGTTSGRSHALRSGRRGCRNSMSSSASTSANTTTGCGRTRSRSSANAGLWTRGAGLARADVVHAPDLAHEALQLEHRQRARDRGDR